MIANTTTTLEDLRNGVYYETRAEFARRLGVTEQTYRRLLQRDPSVENPTKRQVASRLQLPPHLIGELVPPPSSERIAALTAIIDEANRTGSWSILEADGTLTPAPDLTCPPGASDDA
jgi:hypothetical protein